VGAAIFDSQQPKTRERLRKQLGPLASESRK